MKIYAVTFLEYTNSMQIAVKDKSGNYLDVTNPFLVQESDITRIATFGNGIKELTYVGTLANLNNISSEYKFPNTDDDDISKI